MKNVTSRSAARLFELLFLGALACSAAYAQSTPTVLSPGTVVTGQCATHTHDPGCVLPNLFGPGGVTVFANPTFPHYAHFIGSAQQIMNQTLSSAIGTQLAVLP